MYVWPDDVAAYSVPVVGYLYEPSPENPDLYLPVRMLEQGERQELPNGVISEWQSQTVSRAQAIVPLDERPTALYRCYNTADELIYVGIAADPDRRWKQHSSNSEWWPEVSRKEVEWHDDRWMAMRAEARAIRAEDPKYNVAWKQSKST